MSIDKEITLYPVRLYLSSGHSMIVFTPHATAPLFKKHWFAARKRDGAIECCIFWQNRREPALTYIAANDLIAFDESPQEAPRTIEDHILSQHQIRTRNARKKADKKIDKVKEAAVKKTAPKGKF